VPAEGDYAHNAKWGDMNGNAHVRSALIKPFLAIPVHEGKLVLGSWQSIVLIDFDNQPRTRNMHITISTAAA
jgi:secondary thiamine-phosphate synthase enzyme